MFIIIFLINRVLLQLNLPEIEKNLKKFWKSYYIYEKEYLKNTNIWHPKPSKCIFCKLPRQKKVNGIKIKNDKVNFVNLGLEYALYIFQKYKLLVDRTTKVCLTCFNNFIENMEQVVWKNENIYKCSDNIKKTHKLAGILLNSKMKWNGFEKEQKQYYNILDKLVYCVKYKNIFDDKKCKYITGLKVSQFVELANEMIELIKKDALEWNGQKLSYFELDEKLYIFNAYTKAGEKEIIESLALLLIKWKLNCSNKSLHVIVERGRNQVNKKLLKITSAVHLFSNKYLINTRDKMLANTNKKYNELMGISKNIGVVLADGVRYNCYKSRSDFHAGYLIFDNKHKMSSFNTIGFVTTNGKYIGFIPENGLGSDGHHGDGYCMDFILINNVGSILDIIRKNSRPFKRDGTRIIFDRALANGCYTFTLGIFNYATPALKNGPKTTWQNDGSRINATCYRWMVERAYGNIGQVWLIFRAACSRLLPTCLRYFGKWLNLAGAISNKFHIGMPIFDDERIEQTEWMINKKTNNKYNKFDVVYLKTVVDKFRYQRSLKGIWKEVNNIYQLVNYSKTWTLNIIRNHFFLNKKELILYGGGTYSYQFGLRYICHSKYWIRLYISNVKEYENMIMIRGIKKKYTRNWEKVNVKNTKRGDWTFHNVILTYKKDADISLFTYRTWSDEIRRLDTLCDCITGTRQVCADSHILCALIYLEKWAKQENVAQIFKISKYYWKLYDINHWVNLMNSMTEEDLCEFAYNFCCN